MNSRILITGGSGTLGKALLDYNRRMRYLHDFTVFARSELRLAEIKRKYPEVRTVIGDVRNYQAVLAAAAGHDGVIHAAAMKRIPECEQFPVECFLTNVQGSENVARACVAAGVRWCVGLSTDKACNAATTYGASKLMLEGLFQSYAAAYGDSTHFYLVRYGNVVASNGSVVPLWADQARQGLPLTLTHKDMTRFWMSPTQAVDTILQARDVGVNGSIFIPKMRSLRLVDLARQLHPDQPILEIGLRSKEKVHEDLVAPNEQASDKGPYYLIHASGELGHSYCSRDVADLPVSAFMTMLDEAHSLEHS